MKLEIPTQCIARLFCAFAMVIFVPKLYSNIIKNIIIIIKKIIINI